MLYRSRSLLGGGWIWEAEPFTPYKIHKHFCWWPTKLTAGTDKGCTVWWTTIYRVKWDSWGRTGYDTALYQHTLEGI
jgi:hypothetical protein